MLSSFKTKIPVITQILIIDFCKLITNSQLRSEASIFLFQLRFLLPATLFLPSGGAFFP